MEIILNLTVLKGTSHNIFIQNTRFHRDLADILCVDKIIEGDIMSKVVKVIEVLAQSKKSWEDAADNAIKEASKSVKDIKSINIVNTSARVENNKIAKYRITAQISFVVN